MFCVSLFWSVVCIGLVLSGLLPIFVLCWVVLRVRGQASHYFFLNQMAPVSIQSQLDELISVKFLHMYLSYFLDFLVIDEKLN
jgi:hypothetical protein